jgi:hypothetical protein
MLSSFLKVFSFQLKVARFFRATPFDLNLKSCQLEPISERLENRRYLNANYMVFAYIAIAVLIQWMMIPRADDSYILSLTFTLVLVAAVILKLMMHRGSRKVTSLFNSLILHESQEFGKDFGFCNQQCYVKLFTYSNLILTSI